MAEGTVESRLVAILEALERDVPGVRGSAIADHEGLPMANGFHEPFDLLSVAAMSTLALESSKKVFDFIGLGPLRTATLEGEGAKVLAFELGGGQASFIAVATAETEISSLKVRMTSAAREIEEELGFASLEGPMADELFLLSRSGLLIAHVSRSSTRLKDDDIMAGMMAAVQAFVRDSLEQRGGSLREMRMANATVSLVPGRWTTLVFISPTPLRPQVLARARSEIESFEAGNRGALNPWDGRSETLRGVDDLMRRVSAR